MTGNPEPLPSSDRDYLELLMCKLDVMKEHGSAYYARKMQSDERLFKAAKADVNELIRILKKKGYSGKRYDKRFIQTSLL